MKKFFCVLIVMMLLVSCASAETIIVAINDCQGNIAMANEELVVTDLDGDGAVTLCDALTAAHNVGFEGGAEAGFSIGDGGYGKCITKLWGEDNGGSYGYYVNDVSAMNLDDPLQDGDFVKVYAYTDLEMWSDTYCSFDQLSVDCTAGETIRLVLTAQSFDANWNPVSMAVENAVITVNGEDTAFATDAEGAVSLSIDTAGEYVISARSESMVLVAPVCIANVSEV